MILTSIVHDYNHCNSCSFWGGPLQLGLWICKFVIPGMFFLLVTWMLCVLLMIMMMVMIFVFWVYSVWYFVSSTLCDQNWAFVYFWLCLRLVKSLHCVSTATITTKTRRQTHTHPHTHTHTHVRTHKRMHTCMHTHPHTRTKLCCLHWFSLMLKYHCILQNETVISNVCVCHKYMCLMLWPQEFLQ